MDKWYAVPCWSWQRDDYAFGSLMGNINYTLSLFPTDRESMMLELLRGINRVRQGEKR